MAVITYVQNDTLPVRTWLYQGRSPDGALPIDVSAVGTVVRANIAKNNVLKESIVCVKAPGLYKGEDRRTGLWVVDETAPYNVTGSGGIVLIYPNATTFDETGIYLVEYEIIGSIRQTIYKTDEIHVRKQLG